MAWKFVGLSWHWQNTFCNIMKYLQFACCLQSISSEYMALFKWQTKEKQAFCQHNHAAKANQQTKMYD